jgi:signal transduction histidine kinase
MENHSEAGRDKFYKLDNGWPESYAWAIEQMPCPAYCCSPAGALVHINAAAKRLWGEIGPLTDQCWDGFKALRGLDGQMISKEISPAALAVTGEFPGPTELLATCENGQLRWIVIHAKPVFHANGAIVGALCCLTDISEQRLLQKRERDAANAREKFLDMLAHELRNPLAPIMSIAEILQRSPKNDPVIKKMASVVQRQTKQLARFIADLLDASRVDCIHRLPVEPRICTKDEIASLSLDAVKPLVHSRNQRLAIEIDDSAAQLHCDPERVAQALGNVLCNASAFTPDGEEICLHMFIQGNILRAEVIDCGAGIAAEDLPHIFKPFERRASPPGRALEGAGLGLTIAKGVCESHGGSIDVRSAGLGLGTTVSLALPVAVEIL